MFEEKIILKGSIDSIKEFEQYIEKLKEKFVQIAELDNIDDIENMKTVTLYATTIIETL